MHVNTKKIAFLGLLLAFSVILAVLGGYIEPNTLFLIALGAFCTGIAVTEGGFRLGGAWLAGGILLVWFFIPDKMMTLTYAFMGIYLWIRELAFDRIAVMNTQKKAGLFLAVRWLAFNVMYIPTVLAFPGLFTSAEMKPLTSFLLILAGQPVWFILDKAYAYFMGVIWRGLRKKLKFSE